MMSLISTIVILPVPGHRVRKKRRDSRVPSVGSVGTARRVKLSDVISGTVQRLHRYATVLGTTMSLPPFLHPEHLKVGIPSSFLLLATKCLWMYVFCGYSISPLHVLSNCCVVVVDPGSRAVLASSEESDVFVCEQSRETPALVSETASVLPDAEMRHERTQHSGVAVGLEPSIIRNEWEKGIVVVSKGGGFR